MAGPTTEEEAKEYLTEFLAAHGTKSAAEIATLGEEEIRNLQTALALTDLYVNAGRRAEEFIDGDMGPTPSESLTWTGLVRAKTLLGVEGAPSHQDIIDDTLQLIEQVEATFGRDRGQLATRIQQNLNVLDAADLSDGGEDFNMGVQEVDRLMGAEVAKGLAGFYRKHGLTPTEGGRDLLERYLLEGREEFNTYLATTTAEPLSAEPPGASDIRRSDLGGPSGFHASGGENPAMDAYDGVNMGRSSSPLNVTTIQFDGGWTYGQGQYADKPFFDTTRINNSGTRREHDGIDLYQVNGQANAEISMVGGPGIMVHRGMHNGYGRTVITMTDQQDLPEGVQINVTPNNGYKDNPTISGEVRSVSVFTLNGHLNAYGEDIGQMNTGEVLPDGTPIGLNGVSYGPNGRTFSSSPAHLHWETHIRLDMADGSTVVVPVNPQILLGEDLSGPAADLTDPAILENILSTSHTTMMGSEITKHSLAQLRQWDADLDAERANPTRVIDLQRRRQRDGDGALPNTFAQVAQQDLTAISADPTQAKQYIDAFKALSSPSRQEIREVQHVLTAMGLYATHPHKYYADGLMGPVTRLGMRMAEELLNTENPEDSSFTASVIEDVRSLINKSTLTPAETMRLQQNLNYLDRIDDLDGGNDVDLNPDGVDGFLGENVAKASLEAARKYGIDLNPNSNIGRVLRRDGITYDDVASDAPIVEASGDLKTILSSNVMMTTVIEDLQDTLRAAGHNPGGTDGNAGTNTINGTDGRSGLIGALKDDPSLLTDMSEAALAMIWRKASPQNRTWLRQTWDETFPEGNARADWIEDLTAPGNIVASGSQTLLRPDLFAHLDAERTLPDGRTVPVRYFVEKIYDEVEEYNRNLGEGEIPLDANLIVNQLFQESTDFVNGRWVPFYPSAESDAGAQGIAQFLPETGRQWGLATEADRMNPDKAIPAAIAMIGDRTQRYGDQRLAMVAYNGGDGAVDWVQGHRGPNIGIDEWMEYAEQERALKGVGDRSLWRNQTYEYIEKSHSDYWTPDQIAESQRLQQYAGLSTPPPYGEDTRLANADAALTAAPS